MAISGDWLHIVDFFSIFCKGDNFYDFLSVFLCTKPLIKRSALKGKNMLAPCEKGSTLKGNNLLPRGANSFLLELTFFRREAKQF